MGSGKTTVANRLGHDLSAPVVSLDGYVVIRGGDHAYPSRIDRARLLRDVFRHARSRLVLIEGICLRAVLRRSGLRLAATAYVMRLSQAGLWHDGLHLEDFVAGRALDVDLLEPHPSDHRYHATYAPHKAAQFILERRES